MATPECLGARLLDEVGGGGLDEILSELRGLVSQPRPRLGIEPIDRLLEVFCAIPARAPGGSLWTSTSIETGGNDVDVEDNDGDLARQSATLVRGGGVKWKPVILELTSSVPASGKTNLLYYVTALAVLPSKYGGRDTAVVWLDTDGRLSATRLQEVMYGVVSSSTPDEDDMEGIVQEALKHMHVFRPQSSLQLIATLDYLPSYLLDPTAHSSMRRQLGLVVLDSATAFYWQDRFEAENARFEHPDQPRDKPSRTAEVITRLKKVQKEFNCAISFTTSSTLNAKRQAPVVAGEGQAPNEPRSLSPWTALATLTLRMRRSQVPRFASHMSLEECLRDRGKRQEAVAKGRFVIEVDYGGAERWTGDLKDALRKSEVEGSFVVGIGKIVAL